MAGLLYKDFVAVKGKIYVTVMLVVLVLALAVRLFVHTAYIDGVIWAACLMVSGVLYFAIVGKMEISLIAADEGRKQKQYYFSMPVSKNQYVASKYLFLLLTFWVLLSFASLLQTLCLLQCEKESLQEMILLFDGLLPAMTCGFLLLPAIELPFFIGMGTKRGSQVKTGLLIMVFFLIIVYLFFGDLTILDRINFMAILNYLKNHTALLLVLQVAAPYGVFLLYYLSYRISCVLFRKRGLEND